MNTYSKNSNSLTNREFEVLKNIIEGYTNREIAMKLNISIHTVKAHVSSLLEKFNVKTRVSLAVEAVKFYLNNNETQ